MSRVCNYFGLTKHKTLIKRTGPFSSSPDLDYDSHFYTQAHTHTPYWHKCTLWYIDLKNTIFGLCHLFFFMTCFKGGGRNFISHYTLVGQKEFAVREVGRDEKRGRGRKTNKRTQCKKKNICKKNEWEGYRMRKVSFFYVVHQISILSTPLSPFLILQICLAMLRSSSSIMITISSSSSLYWRRKVGGALNLERMRVSSSSNVIWVGISSTRVSE